MKKLIAVTMALSICLALAACGSTGTPSGSDGAAVLETLKISSHPYIHGLPISVAVKEGIYEKNGISPEITLYAGGPAQNEACATNAWEFGTTGMGGVVPGMIGYDMKIIGTSAGESTIDLWVRPDSPIAAVKGEVDGFPEIYGNAELWKGKTIICQSATNCHLLLLATLEKMGLGKEDISMVDMSVAQSFPAFKAGEADMVALWSPFGYLAEQEGWVKVSSVDAVGLKFCNVIVATKKALEEKPELIQKGLQAYLEAADYVRENIDQSPQWLYDYQVDEGITVTLENCGKDIKYRPFPSLEENKELMTSGELRDMILQFADFLVKQGNIKQEDYDKLASTDFIDPSFIEKIQ